MKLYEKVYVEQMDSVDRLMVGRWEEHKNTIVADAEVKTLSNVIVLTIEEFKLAWRDAMAHGVRPYDTDSWDDYLTSKGIKLNPNG